MKRKIPAFVIGLVFVVLLVVRIIGIASRGELHSDETYSVMLAQCNPSYWTPLPGDTVMTGSDIRAMLVADHGIGDDLSQLYVSNHDIPHASLYYMALRVALIGYDSFDASEVAWRGGFLNLIFFAVAFYALWRTCRILFRGVGDSWLISAAVLAVAFGSSIGVDNTLLVREYQMAEMFICLMVWASAALCRNLIDKRASVPSLWIGFALALAGVVSTGYLNSVFVCLVCIAMGIVALVVHRPKAIAGLGFAVVAGIAVAAMLYSGYFNFLIHSTVHTRRAFEGFDGVMTLVFGRAMTWHGMSIAGMVALGLLFIVALMQRGVKAMFSWRRQWWIPFAALLAMIVVEYAAILRAERYVYPFVGSLSLAVALPLCGVNDYWRKCGSIFFVVLMLTLCVLRPAAKSYGWTDMSNGLSDGAVLYSLNPNELPLIAPVLSDTAHYRLVSDPKDLSRLYPPVLETPEGFSGNVCFLPLVAGHDKPSLRTDGDGLYLVGPLKLYTILPDTLNRH